MSIYRIPGPPDRVIAYTQGGPLTWELGAAPAPPPPAPPPPPPPGSVVTALQLEHVDATGVRNSTAVQSGVTAISGVAPLLVELDASGTRFPSAFAAQSAITDEEAFASLMGGYRVDYGDALGTTWAHPAGTAHSRSADTGPPLFAHIYEAGTHLLRLRTRDTLGNEQTIQCTINVAPRPAAVHIPVSQGSWPSFVSGTRYTLDAGGDYRAFGTLETGGRHNIVIEKVGAGADPMIGTFSPDGRSKFSATQMFESRAAHIRLVNVDIGHLIESQRGFDYVGIIGGLVRRYSFGGQRFLWHEGSDIMRSNVRYSRGLFLQDTELRSTTAENGYVMFAIMRGLHARNTRFVHAENGPHTYAMLRVYGPNMTFRNNLWFSQADGGAANGTVISMLSLDGPTPVTWRADDTVGPVTGTTNDLAYGYMSERQIMQHNQLYDSGSFLTNGVSSVGGGNPSPGRTVHGRLSGWEDNVFWPSGDVARSIQNGELGGQHIFWRNNRRDMGAGTHVPAVSGAPNASVGAPRVFNGPYMIETTNTRPVPSAF